MNGCYIQWAARHMGLSLEICFNTSKDTEKPTTVKPFKEANGFTMSSMEFNCRIHRLVECGRSVVILVGERLCNLAGSMCEIRR